MFSGARGRGNDTGSGGAGRGYGFGNYRGGTKSAFSSGNAYSSAMERLAGGNTGLFGQMSTSSGANPYGGLGVGFGGTSAFASPGLAGKSAFGVSPTPAPPPPSRPKVAVVGTTAAAMASWWTLHQSGFDVVVVAGGPDALSEEVDARAETTLKDTAAAFVKGCIDAFGVPQELTEAQKKTKESAAATAKTAAPGLGVNPWSFLGGGGAGAGLGTMGRFGGSQPTPTAAPQEPSAPAAPTEDPALRGVQVCAWTQLISLPYFDEVDVVYVAARAFPSPAKTPAVPANNATATGAFTSASGSGGFNSGRTFGTARARSGSAFGSSIHNGAAGTNPNDGLEAFVLQCVERGKHVVLDVPAATNAASVAAYVEAMSMQQKPKVCLMDRSAGVGMQTGWLQAVRGLCGIPLNVAAETATRSSTARSPVRIGGRRTVSSGRARGRGMFGSGAGSSGDGADGTASAGLETKYASQIGTLCHLRLHLCVPRENDDSTTTETCSKVTQIRSAQPSSQLATAHPMLCHLPPPPAPAHSTRTLPPHGNTTSQPDSSVPSTPMNSGRQDNASTPRSSSGGVVPAEQDGTSHGVDSGEVSEDTLGFGVLGDVAYHAASFYLALFDWAMPVAVMATVLTRDETSGAPSSVEGTLYFRFPSLAEEEEALAARRLTSGARRSSIGSLSSRARGFGGGSAGGGGDSTSASEGEKDMAPRATDTETQRRHAPRIIPARFYVSNDPRAPLTQHFTANGTKASLDISAPIFPLTSDAVKTDLKATKPGAETREDTTDGRGAHSSTSSSPASTPPPPALSEAAALLSNEASSEARRFAALPQTAATYTVIEHTSAVGSALGLRCRRRDVHTALLPARLQPDTELWMGLRHALGLTVAGGGNGTDDSTAAAAATTGGRRGSLGGGASTTSTYSRYTRSGSTSRQRAEPARFPLQDTEAAAKLAKSMYVTQQVVDSLRSATASLR